MKLRPEFVTANIVVESKTTNRFGIDPATKPHWLAFQRTFLSIKENIEKCDHIPLLERWAKFRYDPSGKRYNCDTTISSSLCTVCELDEVEMEVSMEDKREPNRFPSYRRDSNGNIINC